MLKVVAGVLVLALGGCVAYFPIETAPAPAYGPTCDAGVYVCPAAGPPGAPCSCPGIGAPSYGVVR